MGLYTFFHPYYFALFSPRHCVELLADGPCRHSLAKTGQGTEHTHPPWSVFRFMNKRLKQKERVSPLFLFSSCTMFSYSVSPSAILIASRIWRRFFRSCSFPCLQRYSHASSFSPGDKPMSWAIPSKRSWRSVYSSCVAG